MAKKEQASQEDITKQSEETLESKADNIDQEINVLNSNKEGKFSELSIEKQSLVRSKYDDFCKKHKLNLSNENIEELYNMPAEQEAIEFKKMLRRKALESKAYDIDQEISILNSNKEGKFSELSIEKQSLVRSKYDYFCKKHKLNLSNENIEELYNMPAEQEAIEFKKMLRRKALESIESAAADSVKELTPDEKKEATTEETEKIAKTVEEVDQEKEKAKQAVESKVDLYAGASEALHEVGLLDVEPKLILEKLSDVDLSNLQSMFESGEKKPEIKQFFIDKITEIVQDKAVNFELTDEQKEAIADSMVEKINATIEGNINLAEQPTKWNKAGKMLMGMAKNIGITGVAGIGLGLGLSSIGIIAWPAFAVSALGITLARIAQHKLEKKWSLRKQKKEQARSETEEYKEEKARKKQEIRSDEINKFFNNEGVREEMSGVMAIEMKMATDSKAKEALAKYKNEQENGSEDSLETALADVEKVLYGNAVILLTAKYEGNANVTQEDIKSMAIMMAKTVAQGERNSNMRDNLRDRLSLEKPKVVSAIEWFGKLRSGTLDTSGKDGDKPESVDPNLWDKYKTDAAAIVMGTGITMAVRSSGVVRAVFGAIGGVAMGYQLSEVWNQAAEKKELSRLKDMIDKAEKAIEDIEFPAEDIAEYRNRATMVEGRLNLGMFESDPILKARAENFINLVQRVEFKNQESLKQVIDNIKANSEGLEAQQEKDIKDLNKKARMRQLVTITGVTLAMTAVSMMGGKKEEGGSEGENSPDEKQTDELNPDVESAELNSNEESAELESTREMVFQKEHALLIAEADNGGDSVKIESIDDGANHSVVYKIGEKGAQKYLDQGLRRFVVDNMKLEGKFDAVDAAQAENALANLRELLLGKNTAGYNPDDIRDFVTFNQETGELSITDYNAFSNFIEGDLLKHAAENIDSKSDVLAYVDNTSISKWQEMLDSKTEAQIKIEAGGFQAMADAAEGHVFEQQYDDYFKGMGSEAKFSVGNEENSGTVLLGETKFSIDNGRVTAIDSIVLNEPISLDDKFQENFIVFKLGRDYGMDLEDLKTLGVVEAGNFDVTEGEKEALIYLHELYKPGHEVALQEFLKQGYTVRDFDIGQGKVDNNRAISFLIDSYERGEYISKEMFMAQSQEVKDMKLALKMDIGFGSVHTLEDEGYKLNINTDSGKVEVTIPQERGGGIISLNKNGDAVLEVSKNFLSNGEKTHISLDPKNMQSMLTIHGGDKLHSLYDDLIKREMAQNKLFIEAEISGGEDGLFEIPMEKEYLNISLDQPAGILNSKEDFVDAMKDYGKSHDMKVFGQKDNFGKLYDIYDKNIEGGIANNSPVNGETVRDYLSRIVGDNSSETVLENTADLNSEFYNPSLADDLLKENQDLVKIVESDKEFLDDMRDKLHDLRKEAGETGKELKESMKQISDLEDKKTDLMSELMKKPGDAKLHTQIREVSTQLNNARLYEQGGAQIQDNVAQSKIEALQSKIAVIESDIDDSQDQIQANLKVYENNTDKPYSLDYLGEQNKEKILSEMNEELDDVPEIRRVEFTNDVMNVVSEMDKDDVAGSRRAFIKAFHVKAEEMGVDVGGLTKPATNQMLRIVHGNLSGDNQAVYNEAYDKIAELNPNDQIHEAKTIGEFYHLPGEDTLDTVKQQSQITPNNGTLDSVNQRSQDIVPKETPNEVPETPKIESTPIPETLKEVPKETLKAEPEVVPETPTEVPKVEPTPTPETPKVEITPADEVAKVESTPVPEDIKVEAAERLLRDQSKQLLNNEITAKEFINNRLEANDGVISELGSDNDLSGDIDSIYYNSDLSTDDKIALLQEINKEIPSNDHYKNISEGIEQNLEFLGRQQNFEKFVNSDNYDERMAGLNEVFESNNVNEGTVMMGGKIFSRDEQGNISYCGDNFGTKDQFVPVKIDGNNIDSVAKGNIKLEHVEPIPTPETAPASTEVAPEVTPEQTPTQNTVVESMKNNLMNSTNPEELPLSGTQIVNGVSYDMSNPADRIKLAEINKDMQSILNSSGDPFKDLNNKTEDITPKDGTLDAVNQPSQTAPIPETPKVEPTPTPETPKAEPTAEVNRVVEDTQEIINPIQKLEELYPNVPKGTLDGFKIDDKGIITRDGYEGEYIINKDNALIYTGGKGPSGTEIGQGLLKPDGKWIPLEVKEMPGTDIDAEVDEILEDASLEGAETTFDSYSAVQKALETNPDQPIKIPGTTFTLQDGKVYLELDKSTTGPQLLKEDVDFEALIKHGKEIDALDKSIEVDEKQLSALETVKASAEAKGALLITNNAEDFKDSVGRWKNLTPNTGKEIVDLVDTYKGETENPVFVLKEMPNGRGRLDIYDENGKMLMSTYTKGNIRT